VSREKPSTHFVLVLVAGRDGVLQLAEPPNGEAERLSATASMALQTLEALADLYLTRVRLVDVELENGLRVLASPLNGHILVAVTEAPPGEAHVEFKLLEERVSRIVRLEQKSGKKL